VSSSIILIGAGGHSKVIQDCIAAQGVYTIIGILDDRFEESFEENECIYGPLNHIDSITKLHQNVVCLVAIGNNSIRKQIVDKLQGLTSLSFGTVIHPSATVSPSAAIGEGTVVMPNVVVNADSKVGKHSILNSGCIVEHDNILGDFVHISPNVALTGSTTIGEGTHVGAGATTIPSTIIGDWVTVGAGAVVINQIPSGKTAVGVPAKIIT
jgi:acetyltransferase EpsM